MFSTKTLMSLSIFKPLISSFELSGLAEIGTIGTFDPNLVLPNILN